MMRSIYLLVFLVLSARDLVPSSGQMVQDVSIYGKFNQQVIEIDTREIAQVLAKCFWGMGFPTCNAAIQDDEVVSDRNMPYYNSMPDNYGSNYCVQCCGDQEDRVDTWDLMCDMDIAYAASSNVYGYQLRLGANQFDGDQTIITCPLKRTACSYEDDGVTLIGCVADSTYLVGYTLTLNVQKYDRNFNYWRGLTSCSIEAEESTTPLSTGDQFRETIVMKYPFSWAYSLDVSKPVLFLVALLFFAYVILYNCRRKRCCYCQNKLVWSQSMCVRCKLVGAQPPDPVLLAALEDKGVNQQGLEPERFPGSTRAINFIRARYSQASVVWNFRRIAMERRAKEKRKADNMKEAEERVKVAEKAQQEADKEEKDLAAHAENLDGTTAALPADNEESKEGSEGGGTPVKNHGDGDGDGDGGEKDGEEGQMKKEGEVTPKPTYKKPWKYPWYMKMLGFRNKKKEVVPAVNPNLLAYPEHIIYAAVRHHKPPPPDEAMVQEKREMYMESLGYVPGEEVDENGNIIVHNSDDEVEEEEPSIYGPRTDKQDNKYTRSGDPYWQMELQMEREKIRKPEVEEDWWSRWGCESFFMISNPFRKTRAQIIAQKLRGKGRFRKGRLYYCWEEGTCPPLRQAAPFMCLGACIFLFLMATFIILFADVDFSSGDNSYT